MANAVGYRTVAEAIQKDLVRQKRKPGHKLPSVRKIAEKRGVSVFTGTRALKFLEMRGVVERRWGVGCFVAGNGRGSRAKRELTFGVLLDPQQRTSGPWNHMVLEAVLAAVQSEGAQPAYVSWREGLSLDGSVDGVLVGDFSWGGRETRRAKAMADWLRVVSASGIPVMGIDVDLPGVTSVRIDNAGGMSRAARYLIDLGHSRIAYMSFAGNRASGERLSGLRSALESAGLSHDDDLVWPCKPSPHAAYELFGSFYRSQKPTAVCCFEDFGAAGVVKAAREMGLSVPGDLSVVGFGNLSLGEFAVIPLTTVDAHCAEMGRRAVNALVETIETGRSDGSELRAGTELIVRESTGPHRADAYGSEPSAGRARTNAQRAPARTSRRKR